MARKKREFFKESQSQEGLIIPEMAIFCKNDCKEGKWVLGETSYGDELEFAVVGFNRRISNVSYINEPIPQGQIWFTPVSGKLPKGIVYYTLIKNSKSGKSGSMRNFGQQCAIAQSEGYDPREVIWIPKFVKKSGAIKNEDTGETESASWYVLDFSFREENSDEETELIDQTVAIMQSEEQMELLYDMELDKSSICVDGMSREEIASILNHGHPQLKKAPEEASLVAG